MRKAKAFEIDWELVGMGTTVGLGCLLAILPVFVATLGFVWVVLRLFA